MMPFHCIISNFEKKLFYCKTKDFFSQSFHCCKLFHERVSCAKNGTERQFNSIRYIFKIWFNQSEKSSIVVVRLGSKYASVNITLQLTFYISYKLSYNILSL